MRLVFFLSTFFLIFFGCQQKLIEPEIGVLATKAMVVSARAEATLVGQEVLQKGGNAVDAAVAVQFALAVVYPIAGNIGGGGFLVYRDKDGSCYSLDFREKAPIAANRDMYLDDQGNVIDDLSTFGHLSAGVPGTVMGMYTAHERFGKLPWEVLLEGAIKLAKQGIRITEQQADYFNKFKGDLRRFNKDGMPLIKNEMWKEGDSLFQRDLAQTLERIRDLGPEGFYKGKTAELILAEMNRGRGLISEEDLIEYEAVWREPLFFEYKDYFVISMPPPSSGGIALGQLLEIIEEYPLKEWGWQSSRSVHLIVEAEKRVYADRSVYLGDPDFWDVPVEELLDKTYLRERMSDFSMDRASSSKYIREGKLLLTESPQTTHFSIVDGMGNAVSLTTTLNAAYGSKVMVEGAGFILNNEMDDFSVKAGIPNLYGLLGGDANAIEPGKRMLSSMTPTIVEKDGSLFMVIGTPGGSTIITSVLQNILNVVEFGMSMQESVSTPRFHHQWKPDSIRIENKALSDSVYNRLLELGHIIYERESIGKVDAILIRDDGFLEGAADPRGDDTAMGLN